MAFTPRTDEEMMTAFDWWFLNHPYPDKSFFDPNLNEMTTPRKIYSTLRNNPILADQFCFLMLLIAAMADQDPLEMIKNAPYDQPYK